MAVVSLIARVSAQIAEFQKSFADVNKSISGIESSLGRANRVLGTFGVGLGAAAVVGFVKNITNAASEIVDLSNKLGISTEAVQRLQFVAGQTGTTIDAFGRAMFVLGTNIAGGDKSAAAGLAKLGLSFKDLEAQSPEKQFDLVVSALGRMTNAQERNLALTQIFGAKVAQELAKAVAEYERLAKIAPVAADAQVRSTEALGDAYDRLKARVQKFAIEGIGAAALRSEEAHKQFGTLGTVMDGVFQAIPGGTRVFAAFNEQLALMRGLSSDPKGTLGLTVPKAPGAPSSFQSGGLTAPIIDVTEVTYKLNKEIERTNAAYDKAKAAADAYRESVKSLSDELSGARLRGSVKQLTDAFNLLTTEQKKSPAVMDRVGAAAERLRQEGAKLPPVLQILAVQTEQFSGWLNKVPGQTELWANSFVTLRSATAPAIVTLNEYKQTVEAIKDLQLDLTDWNERTNPLNQAPQEIKKVDDGIQNLARSFSQLAQISGGTFGTIVQEIANIIGAFDVARQAVEAYGKATTAASKAAALASGAAAVLQATGSGSTAGRAFGGALSGAAIGSAFGPIGTAVGAVAGFATGLLRGALAATEYEKRTRAAALAAQELIASSIAGAGGLDKLRAQFSIVGIQIDEAFKTRNPDWIRKVLDEGYAKTQLLTAAMQEYGFTWEHMGAEGRALKLGEAFDELFAKTSILKQSGIDYTAILEKQSGQYSDLIQKAVRSGTEIPAAYKQVLIDAARLGFLFDEAGNKMSEADVEGLSFAKTLTQGFDNIEKAVLRVVDVLERKLGGALSTLGRGVNIPISFTGGGVSPTSGGLGGGVQNISVYLDGQVLTHTVVKGMPAELALYGV